MLLDQEHDIAVIGVTPDGRTAVTMAVDDPPDVVLMNVSLPVPDGLAATREIVRALPPSGC